MMLMICVTGALRRGRCMCGAFGFGWRLLGFLEV